MNTAGEEICWIVRLHEADIAEQLEHSIDGGGLKFDLFSKDYKHKWSVFTSAQNTDRDGYYRTNLRSERLRQDYGPDGYGRYAICL